MLHSSRWQPLGTRNHRFDMFNLSPPSRQTDPRGDRTATISEFPERASPGPLGTRGGNISPGVSHNKQLLLLNLMKLTSASAARTTTTRSICI